MPERGGGAIGVMERGIDAPRLSRPSRPITMYKTPTLPIKAPDTSFNGDNYRLINSL